MTGKRREARGSNQKEIKGLSQNAIFANALLKSGSGKTVPAWGCCDRISNGRSACDSHHVNEDTLQRTYLAAIRDMIDDAEDIMEAVRECSCVVKKHRKI